ncbi:MAG: HEAT repeat domain-containing protein [Bacillota bacterium]
MGFLFGPPKVDKLKSKRDVRGLLKALTYEKDWMIRNDAARALGEIGATAAIPYLVARLVSEESYSVREALVGVLDRLGWIPQKDAASARYYRLKGELQKCAECGDDGIRELLPLLLEGNSRVRDVWLGLGAKGALTAMAVANMLFEQYRDLTSGTSDLDFRLADDRRKDAMIEAMVKRLGNCVRVIGQYGDPSADIYLANLYDQVKQSIYSNPEGGFLDAFKAVDLRESIVWALSRSTSQPALDLHLRVLTEDRARFVRWASVDVLANLNEEHPGLIRGTQFREALESALALEEDGISNRKGKIRDLLASMGH